MASEKEFESLASSLSMEVSRLGQLIEERNRRQAEEEARLENLARAQAKHFEEMMLQRERAEQARDHRRRWYVKYIILPILGTIFGSGTVFGVKILSKTKELEESQDAKVEAKVDEKVDELTGAKVDELDRVKNRLAVQDAKLDRLAQILLENYVMQVERDDYIIKKLTKSKTEQEPPSMEDGRTTARKIIKVRESWPDWDRARPFADLNQETEP